MKKIITLLLTVIITFLFTACNGLGGNKETAFDVSKEAYDNVVTAYKIIEKIGSDIAKNVDYTLNSKVELKLPSLDGSKLLRYGGEGVCTLNRDGLTYVGTKDGCDFEIQFPISKIYRLLFGAGEDFEVYIGNELYYFIPEERRSCVEWYMTSILLYDATKNVAEV